MKIPSTLDNVVRSKFSAQMMFSQDDEVEGRKDVKFLNGFPFFGSHTTNVESETVEGSICLFIYFVSVSMWCLVRVREGWARGS